MRRRLSLSLCLAAGAAAVAAPGAVAAPPPNDAPSGATAFETFTAENGTPAEQQATARLAEATADAGVPSCLGAGSFARTVWFSVPAAAKGRELKVEGTGSTTAVPDLAVFVQPAGATGPVTAEPNVCGGPGTGSADAGGEPAAAVALRVPPGQAVLVQVGRRAEQGGEDVLLSLAQTELDLPPGPAGDRAGDAPRVTAGVPADVALGGATITEEDPAQPACSSLGSVWRRFDAPAARAYAISVDGPAASTLTVHAGAAPTGDNALACTDRESSAGPIAVSINGTPGTPLWIRVGADRPANDAAGRLLIADAGPTSPSLPGPSPAPGLSPAPGPVPVVPPSDGRGPVRPPVAARRTRLFFSRFGGSARKRARTKTIVVRLRTVNGTVSRISAVLVGPRGRVYAAGRRTKALRGKGTLTIKRSRRYVRGVYRLRILGRVGARPLRSTGRIVLAR